MVNFRIFSSIYISNTNWWNFFNLQLELGDSRSTLRCTQASHMLDSITHILREWNWGIGCTSKQQQVYKIAAWSYWSINVIQHLIWIETITINTSSLIMGTVEVISFCAITKTTFFHNISKTLDSLQKCSESSARLHCSCVFDLPREGPLVIR